MCCNITSSLQRMPTLQASAELGCAETHVRSALWDTVPGCVVAGSWDTVPSGFPFGVWDAFFEQDQRKRPRSAAAALGCTLTSGDVAKRPTRVLQPPVAANPGAVLGYRYTDKSRFNALNVFLYFCISVTPFRPDFSRLNRDLSVGL